MGLTNGENGFTIVSRFDRGRGMDRQTNIDIK